MTILTQFRRKVKMMYKWYRKRSRCLIGVVVVCSQKKIEVIVKIKVIRTRDLSSMVEDQIKTLIKETIMMIRDRETTRKIEEGEADIDEYS